MIAPMGMPRHIIDKLNAAINRSMVSPVFKERFATTGNESAGGTPEEFGEWIKIELIKWRDVVQRTGAKFD